jgi:hypothetical protein
MVTIKNYFGYNLASINHLLDIELIEYSTDL